MVRAIIAGGRPKRILAEVCCPPLALWLCFAFEAQGVEGKEAPDALPAHAYVEGGTKWTSQQRAPGKVPAAVPPPPSFRPWQPWTWMELQPGRSPVLPSAAAPSVPNQYRPANEGGERKIFFLTWAPLQSDSPEGQYKLQGKLYPLPRLSSLQSPLYRPGSAEFSCTLLT